ncbi:hypothetical protein [Gracilinema caldarium]|uniref:hypothetical protein n=1 Tax=Gracilinema caldarium TaxID=215591 RepID=UPI0026EEED11|nr:hypothetical protein [Gracilinema caldarium]
MKSEKSDGNKPAYPRLLPSDSIQKKDNPRKEYHSRPVQEQIFSGYPQKASLSSDVIAKRLSLSPTPLIRSAISFALHFGIPLKKEAIEGLIAQTSLLAEDLKEAGLVASLIARTKGLGLSKPALEELAALLSAYSERAQHTKVHQKGEKAPLKSSVHENGSANPDEEPDKEAADREAAETPTDPALAAHYCSDGAKQHALINLLNRFPHHHKQRLLILPFQFSEKTYTLKGTLRLLCTDNPQGILEVQSLVLDAATEKRRWYVQAAGNNGKKPNVTMWIFPPPASSMAKESIIKSLSTISDTVQVRFDKPESFQEFKEQNYTSFEFHI